MCATTCTWATIAAAHVAAAQRLADGSTIEPAYNLGSGDGLSVKQIMDAVARVTGIDFTPEIGPRRPGDPDRIVATGELAARDLDWTCGTRSTRWCARVGGAAGGVRPDSDVAGADGVEPEAQPREGGEHERDHGEHQTDAAVDARGLRVAERGVEAGCVSTTAATTACSTTDPRTTKPLTPK